MLQLTQRSLNYLPPMRTKGFGYLGATAGQVQAGAAGALSIAATAASNMPTGTKIEASIGTALLTAAALTPPPANAILAAAGVIAEALAAFGVGAGCGDTCIKATAIVNQAEPAFLANVQQYHAGQISQEQAQQTYINLWTAVQVACKAIPGAAGQNCISDRAAGSCKWHQTDSSPLLAFPGEPQPGECWNWYLGYFGPLTVPALVPYVDPNAQASSATGGDSLASFGAGITSALAGIPSSYYLVGAGLLLLVAASGGKN
jgi:hypothetical protein